MRKCAHQLNLADVLIRGGANVRKSCRSRQELSNEYLLAKFVIDTAENEPLKVWRKIQFIIHSPPYQGPPRRCPHGPPCDGHQWRLGVDAWERLFDRRHRASPGSLID